MSFLFKHQQLAHMFITLKPPQSRLGVLRKGNAGYFSQTTAASKRTMSEIRFAAVLLQFQSAALESHSFKNPVHVTQVMCFLAFLLAEKNSFLAWHMHSIFYLSSTSFHLFVSRNPGLTDSVIMYFLCKHQLVQACVFVHIPITCWNKLWYIMRKEILSLHMLSILLYRCKTTISEQAIDIRVYNSFATFVISLDILSLMKYIKLK